MQATSALDEHEKNLLSIANAVAKEVVVEGLDDDETQRRIHKAVNRFLNQAGAVDQILMSTHMVFEDEDVHGRMLATNPFLKEPSKEQVKRYTAVLALETELKEVLSRVLKERRTPTWWKIHLFTEKRYLTFDETCPECADSLDGMEAWYTNYDVAYCLSSLYVSAMNILDLHPQTQVIGFNSHGEIVFMD